VANSEESDSYSDHSPEELAVSVVTGLRGTFTINASFGQVGRSQNRFRGTASSTFPTCLHVPFSGESFISSNDYFHLLQFQGTETLFCQGHCFLLAPPRSTSSRANSFYLFNCFQPRSPSQSPISFDDNLLSNPLLVTRSITIKVGVVGGCGRYIQPECIVG